MRRLIALSILFVVNAGFAFGQKSWHVKADYIEACSCNMFCECYFNTHPEGSEICEFNNAIRIREGNYGNVKLDGAKFWMSGDLGGDFTKPLKTAVITYDVSLSPEQRDAIKFLIGKIYPFKFEKVIEDEAPITWEHRGATGHAVLGTKGEVTLTGIIDGNGKPTTIRNLAYWGAQRNDGFELAYSKHFYKANGMDYSYDRKNGFFITIESSGTVGAQ